MTTGPRGPIRDPDVGLLASIAGTLRDDYVKSAEADPWSDSPFRWIKTRPSRQVGKIGEQLVAGWCAAKGFDVTKSGDSEADRVIAGKRVEIKFPPSGNRASSSSSSCVTRTTSTPSASAFLRSTLSVGRSPRKPCSGMSSE